MGKLRVHNIEAQTGTNVDLGAAGDVVTFASDSIQTNLYKDSGANTIFQSDGAGTLSNVNSSLTGAGPKLILSQTASSSTSIDFTSGIDSTYDKYMFVFVDIHPGTDATTLKMEASINGGSAWNTNVPTTSTYFKALHYENGTSGQVGYDAGQDLDNSASAIPIAHNIDNDNDSSASGVLYLFSPSSTTYVKNFYSTFNVVFHQTPNGTAERFASGYMNTTSAINAIRFIMSAGNIDAGKIKMYGIG